MGAGTILATDGRSLRDRRILESEARDLRGAKEADFKKVTDAAVDIKRAVRLNRVEMNTPWAASRVSPP